MGNLMFDWIGVIRKFLVVFGASVLLTACGDSGDPPEEDSSAEHVIRYPGLAVFGLGRDENPNQVPVSWLASIRTFRENSFPGAGGFVYVDTLQYDAYTVQGEIDWRLGQDEIGSCAFADDPVTGGGDSSPPYVTGGTSIVINSPSGPWARLPIGDDLQYVLEPNPGPLPV